LRQHAERSEPRPEREHHVGLVDHVHRRLRPVVAERPHASRCRRRERVVVQVRIADRRVERSASAIRARSRSP
jgi:hypothetical protein